MTKTQVGGGSVADKRALNSVPSKRYGAPITAVVAMDAVPEPPPRNGSIAETLYAQIKELPASTRALKVEFETSEHADYVRTKLRSLAKKAKLFMSSSRSTDGKTRYFWLEKL
jgi:lipoprotein-anchoring transpeptidase ErfK/SrfK